MAFSKLRLTTVIAKSIQQCSSFTSGGTKLSASKVKLPNQNRMSYAASQLKEKYIYWLDNIDKEDEELQELMKPCTYLMQVPKKEARSILLRGLNHWMKLPADKIQVLEEITVAGYEYFVMLDDMLDNSKLRRRLPTAHRIYGPERTSLSCNALMMLILKRLMDFDNLELIKIYHEEMLRYFKGQNKEISWLLNFKCPTVPEYFEVIGQKTQSGYNFAIKVMQTMSECKEDFGKLSKLLSLFYQFQNDYCNLHQKQYWETKGFGDDISEGKFTLPIIHAANSGTPDGEVVLNIVRQKTADIEMKKHCVYLLEKLGSLEYTRQVTVDIEQQLRAEIDRLGGNPILHKMIDLINLWKNDEKFASSS